MAMAKPPPKRKPGPPSRGLRGNQIAVAVPDDLRERLIAESTVRGISVAEEVRQRLDRSFEEDDFYASRPDLRELVAMVITMARMVERATGEKWNEHDATGYLLQLAITRHLEIHGAEEVDEIETTEAFQRGSKGIKKSYKPEFLAEMIESIAHFRSHGQRPDYEAAKARELETLEKAHQDQLRRLTPEEREQYEQMKQAGLDKPKKTDR
jgi:hypothetical protein